MIAYNEKLSTFYEHINQNVIADLVQEKLGFRVGESEENAFRHSLPAVANALRNADLPGDIEVAIEYKIPLTNRRIGKLILMEQLYLILMNLFIQTMLRYILVRFCMIIRENMLMKLKIQYIKME